MRIYYIIIISFLFISCQVDIDDDDIERIPVFDIEIPSEIFVDVDNTISFKYALVNSCYSFYDIEYDDSDGDIRTITAFAIIESDNLCAEYNTVETYNLTFKPKEAKTYFFRFWIGLDNQGNDMYEEFELVTE